jgi:succinate dehydrogenase / fumarate reductase flavoprotein subunit
VAIIGAGGAGLRAACAASQMGLSVLCISKVPVTRSHTVAAQGGINAALGTRAADDWRWHMYDTVRGSDWLGDQDAIAFMCERAPAAITELEHMGMPFTRSENGRIYQRAYGGQSTDFGKGPPAYRACAVADRTGHALLHTLYAQAKRQGVCFAEEWMALDLLFSAQGECAGVLAWQLETGELHAVNAKTTILATGGYGQAWASTTASSVCTGDGGGMILRAGLPLQDMEFVQFHPTSLYGSGILITEGARGEGAILRNGLGERFMERYAPHSMELASRDVIARAMAREIIEGRGCGPLKDHLHLCLDHMDAAIIRAQLPSVLEIAHTFARIDATREPIPVLPAVHYTMGGIPSDMHSSVGTAEGQPVPRLLAIGEAACNSIHGANRLGCNSLLDLVVFGKAAGERCAELTQGSSPGIAPPSLQTALARFERLRTANGGTRPTILRQEMQCVMQHHAGIFRTHDLLAQGRDKLAALWNIFQTDLHLADRSTLWNNDLLDALETENLLRQAMATLQSALVREESRGAHWRDDFPARNDAHWLAHTLAWQENGIVRTAKREVRMAEFPPETRVY